VSNLEREPRETVSGGTAVVEPEWLELAGRLVPLGRYAMVRRFLPHRARPTVGAWCFVDHYGPDDVTSGPGMAIPPHPHCGLQTVSWLLEGEVLHRDSLGSEQLIRPGQLNLMTAGRGIAHSEQSPAERPPALHGVQLWIASPDATRDGPARFDHHADLPVLRLGPATVTVLAGSLGGAASPARVETPLVGADVTVDEGGEVELDLEPGFEHAVVTLSGAAEVDGRALGEHTMAYLGCGRSALRLTATAGAGTRLLLLGGTPFEEPLVMWWNFVGRTHEDVDAARRDWQQEIDGGRVVAHDDGRFGAVVDADAGPLPAPPLPLTRLKPRTR
jgi:hypothetical protein